MVTPRAVSGRQLVGHRDLVIGEDVARIDAEALVGQRLDALEERHDVRGPVIVARHRIVARILPDRVLGEAGGDAVPVARAASDIEPLDEPGVRMIGDEFLG